MTGEKPVKNKEKKRSLRVRVVRTIALLCVIYTVWLLAACSLQERILFPGATVWNTLTRPAVQPGDVWEKHVLRRDDGTLGRMWMRPAIIEEGERAPVAFFFHGNADIARNRTDIGTLYAGVGVHTVLVEYPGYDGSEGTPGQEGILRDARLALELVLERDDVDPDRLIFHGHSIGGGAAAQLAGVRTPAVLILESTFTSMVAMVNRYAVPSFVLRHRFETDRVLETLDIPVLVMHGDLDVIIYPSHGERNAQTARDATFVRFPTCGHDGCYTAPNYRQVVRDFLIHQGIVEE